MSQRRAVRGVSAGAVAIVAVASGGAAAGVVRPAAVSSAPRWRASFTKTYTHGGQVVGVVAFSTKDAVAAVNHGLDVEEGTASTQLLHWNGSTWTPIKHQPPQDQAGIDVITARSDHDIWIESGYRKLRHFDGTHWTTEARTGLPGVIGRKQYSEKLLAVRGHTWMAVSRGTTSTAIYAHSASRHRWTKVASFKAGSVVNSFKGTASNAWVVGPRPGGGSTAIHWTGRHWRSTKANQPANQTSGFLDVYPASATSAMAVGWSRHFDSATQVFSTVTYAYLWNGKGWHETALPPGTYGTRLLDAVAGASSGAYWAAGPPHSEFVNGQPYPPGPSSATSVYYRYVGGTWRVVDGPTRTHAQGALPFVSITAMAHVNGTSQNWAVGIVGDHSCDEEDTCVNHSAATAIIDRLS